MTEELRTYTTAEITEGIRFGRTDGKSASIWMLKVQTGRKMGQGGRLGRPKETRALTADTLPELLRDAASVLEETESKDLDALAAKLKEAFA